MSIREQFEKPRPPKASKIGGLGEIYLKPIKTGQLLGLGDADDDVNAGLELVVATVVEQDGRQVFADIEDLKATVDADLLKPLIEACAGFNGVERKVDQAKGN